MKMICMTRMAVVAATLTLAGALSAQDLARFAAQPGSKIAREAARFLDAVRNAGTD